MGGVIDEFPSNAAEDMLNHGRLPSQNEKNVTNIYPGLHENRIVSIKKLKALKSRELD